MNKQNKRIELNRMSSAMKCLFLSVVAWLFATGAASAQIYPVIWTDLTNTIIGAGNTLIKTGGTETSYDGGALGYNQLPPNTDGALQITCTATRGYMIGLSVINSDANYPSVDYGLVIGSSLGVYEKGINQGTVSTLVVGDVLKVSREGGFVRYYKNGVVVRSVALTAAAMATALYPDVSISTKSVAIPAATVSFNTRALCMKPDYTFPSLSNTNVGITMTTEGGDAPYSYVWTTGETTAGISNKPRGTYGVTVTDAAGRTASASYYLGYPIAWSNVDNVSVNANGSLTRTLPSVGWQSRASSLNVLQGGENGYIEFTLTDIVAPVIIGLSDFDPDQTLTNIDFGISIAVAGTFSTYRGGVGAVFGTFKKGDVFRIGRQGTTVSFYRNGVVFSTATVAPSMPLLAIAAIYNGFAPSPVITASVDKQIRFKPVFTFPDEGNTNGSIALSVEGTYTPAVLSWLPSQESGYLITGKSRGSYTATVTDAASRTHTRTYRLGYPITWTDLQNMKVNADNTLTQTVGQGVWTAGAISGNSLAPNTDGWIEFVIPRSGVSAMIGLSTMNAVTSIASMDYVFNIGSGNVLFIYERGSNRGLFGYLQVGDVVAISREGSNIKYYLNGAVLRTVATTPAYVLYADVSTSTNVGPTPLITSSFGRLPQTFYCIADGNWTTPSTWSLTEGGSAAGLYPVSGDIVHIKGFSVIINTGVSVTDVHVTVTNNTTLLKIDTALGMLDVKGHIYLQGISNTATTTALQVRDKARLTIQSP